MTVATEPKTGITYGVPEAVYRAIDARCQTDLKVLAECPAKYHYWRDRESKQTADQLTGTVCHTSILEPHRFDEKYEAHDKPNQRAKAAKEAWAKLEGEVKARGRTIITLDDYELAMRTRDAIQDHPAAKEFLDVLGGNEVVARWDENGVECKARIDRLSDGRTVAIDIKTSRSVHPSAFASSIRRYGYQVQASFYSRAVEACAGPIPVFYIIAVEKTPPYLVGVFRIDTDMLAVGEAIWRRGMERYIECTKSGRWPGYSDEVQLVQLPEWQREGDDDDGGDEDLGF